MDPVLIKETTLSSPSPSINDSDDEKSERLLKKEADMAVYLDHHSESSSPRTPSLRLQTTQSREDIADQEDGLQHAHTAQHLVTQQAPRRSKPVAKAQKRKGLKAFLLCCFKPDLSKDEEEEEAMEYKMETYHPRVVSTVYIKPSTPRNPDHLHPRDPWWQVGSQYPLHHASRRMANQ